MGSLTGPGWSISTANFSNGGTFAGQGGSSDSDNFYYNNLTYGGYDMVYNHNVSDPTIFYGSGGGIENKESNETRGGGIITM